MNFKYRPTLSIALMASAALISCKGKGEEGTSATKKNTKPAKAAPAAPKTPAVPAHAAMPMKMDKSKDIAHAKEVWTGITGYHEWTSASPAPVKSKRPHGAFVRVFYNDTMKAAVAKEGDWPAGSVIIKDNFMPNAAKDGPGMLAIVTVMQKDGDKWFWAKFKPDGTLAKTPADSKMPNMPIAGSAKLKCIGCHDGKSERDFVVTNLVTK